MNKYGQLAMTHWQETDPTRYAAIPNPGEFFSTLGEQVQYQVLEVSDKLAGSDLAGEQYMAKVARLNTARLQAEELVLADLVWISVPETCSEAPDPWAGVDRKLLEAENEELMNADNERWSS